MFGTKKSTPFDLDHYLLVALDKAREAGISARAIAAAFQNRADQVRQLDAMTRPHSGAIGTVYYDALTMRPKQ
jgi:hypothetical protein